MSPELSIVVIGDDAPMLQRLFEALEAQAGRDRFELVLVAPPDQQQSIAELLPAGFGAVRAVARRRGGDLALSRAAGLRAATAPIAVLTETHALPEPGWAQALLRCHRRPCAAVGPTVVNANPATRLSEANFLLDYGPFAAGKRQDGPRATRDIAGHNSSYKREALDALFDDLPALLRCDFALHAELRRRGGVLLIDPAARVRHFNVSRAASALVERWWAGREFATGRSLRWSRRRRALQAAGAPAVPVLRAMRALRRARRLGHGRRALPAMPWLLIGVTVQSAGEAVGYVRGSRPAPPGLIEMELLRFDHLARKDRDRARG